MARLQPLKNTAETAAKHRKLQQQVDKADKKKPKDEKKGAMQASHTLKTNLYGYIFTWHKSACRI